MPTGLLMLAGIAGAIALGVWMLTWILPAVVR